MRLGSRENGPISRLGAVEETRLAKQCPRTRRWR